MRNLIIITAMCFLFIGQVSAQLSVQDNNPVSRSGLEKGQHQLGVSTNLNGVYNITHRYALKDDLLLRSTLKGPSFGLGFRESNGERNTQFGIGAAMGIEKHMPLGKKWSVYYGAELEANFNSRGGGFNQIGVGLSGLAGVKYNVNERLSLFAEVNYGYRFSRVHSEFVGKNYRLSRGGGIKFGVLLTLGKKN